MTAGSFQFDGFCGQCAGSNGNFVALGSWSLMVTVRDMFLSSHGHHVPFELSIQKVEADSRTLGRYDVSNDTKGVKSHGDYTEG